MNAVWWKGQFPPNAMPVTHKNRMPCTPCANNRGQFFAPRRHQNHKSHRLRRGIRRSSSNLPDGSAWCTSAASSETPERHHRYMPYRTIVRPRQQPETTTMYCLTVCKNTAQKTRTILANNPAANRTPTVHTHRDRVLPDGVGPGVPNFAQHAQVRLVQGVQPQGSHLRHVRAQRPVDTCPPTKRHNKRKSPAGEISRKKKKSLPKARGALANTRTVLYLTPAATNFNRSIAELCE